MPYDLSVIRVSVAKGVATAVIDNPPINLLTRELFRELRQLATDVEADENVQVLVIKSADRDFFIPHFDVSLLSAMAELPAPDPTRPNPFNLLCEMYRTMDTISIAQIEGRLGGGGSEFVQACDMRFGVRGRTVLNHMEVGLGIIPGGGGTQRLPRLVGRGRALEIILGGQDIDADTAERWGYLNRTFAAEEIDAFVQKLACRIASFSPAGLQFAKRATDLAEGPLPDGLAGEAVFFQRLLRDEGSRAAMVRFLALGGQTREIELRVGELSFETSAVPAERPLPSP